MRKEKIISALRCSIAEQYKGFNVYYQPIMDCATETITGAEALMRFTMDSEEGPEVISPIEFIPLLEETGLDAVPQAAGYLTLSTCNDRGGNSRVLVVAELVGEVCP